jgi:hypothetical protein
MFGPYRGAGVGGAVKGEALCARAYSATLDCAHARAGYGHTHEAHAARGARVTKGWTAGESVPILFSWSRRKRKEIGGCGSAIWRRMRWSSCTARVGAASSITRGICSGGIGCRRIFSSTICSSVCAARTVTPAWVFASPFSTRAHAAIIGSRGWSGWLWGGR